MIKKIKIFNTILTFLFILFSYTTTVTAEKISSFSSVITLGKNDEITVTESITYDSEGRSKHGIYRSIPLSTVENSPVKRGSIKIFFVTDENNISVPYKESTSIIGGQAIKIIKIGDRKVTFNGVKKYNIGYTFSHALSLDNTNPNRAYLYYNITGNAWPFKVEKGEFSIVSGPGGPKLDTSKAECFTGRFGQNKGCLLSNEQKSETFYKSEFSNTLSSGEGITLRIPLSYNTSPFPSKGYQYILNYWDALLYLGISALLIVITIFLYRKYGKDPDNGRPIVTEFTPPKGISLLEASYILNEKIELKALGSELIEQARLGNLIIEARENNHFLGVIKNISFTLIIIKSPVDKAAALLVSFLEQSTKVSSPQPYRASAPFLSGISPSIGESSDRTNRVNIDLDKAKIDLLGLSKINSSLERSLLEKGLFDNMLGSILKKFFGVILTFFITYVFSHGIALPESPYALVLVVVIILCVITLTRSLNRKTAHGVDIKYQLLGLKRYIDIAEEERIAFHNAPSKTPEYYLELLPWAMLFGLEKKWSKEFEGISFNQNDVSFYRSNTPFSSAGFTSGLGASLESFSRVASQAAIVAYSGGGGRGGGGFSGGGGGVGGGRSW